MVFLLVGTLAYELKQTNEQPTITVEQTVTISPVIIEEKEPEKKDIKQLALEVCQFHYSWEVADEIFKECEKYNLPVHVAYALMLTESDGVKEAESDKNCRGLFQTGKKCLIDYNNTHWEEPYTFDDMYSVRKNIKVGIWHYQRYRNRVNDDWVKLYAIYNNGYSGYLQKGTANIQSAVDRFSFYLKEMEVYFY